MTSYLLRVRDNFAIFNVRRKERQNDVEYKHDVDESIQIMDNIEVSFECN